MYFLLHRKVVRHHGTQGARPRGASEADTQPPADSAATTTTASSAAVSASRASSVSKQQSKQSPLTAIVSSSKADKARMVGVGSAASTSAAKPVDNGLDFKEIGRCLLCLLSCDDCLVVDRLCGTANVARTLRARERQMRGRSSPGVADELARQAHSNDSDSEDDQEALALRLERAKRLAEVQARMGSLFLAVPSGPQSAEMEGGLERRPFRDPLDGERITIHARPIGVPAASGPSEHEHDPPVVRKRLSLTLPASPLQFAGNGIPLGLALPLGSTTTTAADKPPDHAASTTSPKFDLLADDHDGIKLDDIDSPGPDDPLAEELP